MSALEDARAVVSELRDAQGDGTDWTEDLFKRAADMIEILSAPPTDDEREALDLRDVREVFAPSDLWDGDEDEQSIILRFIAHYSALDRALADARKAADYEDDAPIWFQWDAASGSLVLRRQGPITDAQVEAAARSNYWFQNRACIHPVPDWSSIPESDPFKGAYRAEAREALEAARAV